RSSCTRSWSRPTRRSSAPRRSPHRPSTCWPNSSWPWSRLCRAQPARRCSQDRPSTMSAPEADWLEDYQARQNERAAADWAAKLPPLPPEDPMPNTRAMYPPSKYLGAQDFPQPVIATIAGVQPENFKAQGQREAETRWILY